MAVFPPIIPLSEAAKLKIITGTSGFSYPEWKGSFYPQKLAARDMLGWYAARLPAVEINNTFYRLPKAHVLEGWAPLTPERFRFVLKASRRITHMGRLGDVADATEYLLHVAGALGDRLGAILFQLPPNMKKDTAKLRAFLSLLAGRVPVAFEFRHPSWPDDDVLALLGEFEAAYCNVDDLDWDHEPISTTNWGYLRLRRPDYTDDDLRAWIDRVGGMQCERVYVFFKHEDAGAAPRLALRMLELESERGGAEVTGGRPRRAGDPC
jgi:uncharacterized protein YecE (DUF72 family)